MMTAGRWSSTIIRCTTMSPRALVIGYGSGNGARGERSSAGRHRAMP
jgi:hypothetical protein